MALPRGPRQPPKFKSYHSSKECTVPIGGQRAATFCLLDGKNSIHRHMTARPSLVKASKASTFEGQLVFSYPPDFQESGEIISSPSHPYGYRTRGWSDTIRAPVFLFFFVEIFIL